MRLAPAASLRGSSGVDERLFRRLKSLSRGDPASPNAIIQGDNLEVMRLLLSDFESRIDCCYIDPPYNNFERHYHYHDSQNHEQWMSKIVSRIELIYELLGASGSLWISIDDREVHYLKVACDKIFGRRNFVTTIVWQQRTSRENRKVFSNNHEYLLVYAKDVKKFAAKRNLFEPTPAVLDRYRNPDGDPRGPWQSVSAHAQSGHGTPAQYYEIKGPKGDVHYPPPGRCWVYAIDRMREEIEDGNVYFGREGRGVPRLKKFRSEMRLGLTPDTLWLAGDVGTNDIAKKHLLQLFPNDVFDTPKPEQLIRRVLEVATDEGDLVLDSYLGSGTTAAVAHKIDRRYIGIEMGEHVVTHCVKRLSGVVSGERMGISTEVGWSGGGGFGFYRVRGSR